MLGPEHELCTEQGGVLLCLQLLAVAIDHREGKQRMVHIQVRVEIIAHDYLMRRLCHLQQRVPHLGDNRLIVRLVHIVIVEDYLLSQASCIGSHLIAEPSKQGFLVG